MSLVTPEQIKAHIVKNDQNTNIVTFTAKLETFQAAGEAFVKTYCNRPLEEQTVTNEKWNGGAYKLSPILYPIVSIQAVRVDGVAVDPDSYVVSNDKLFIEFLLPTTRGRKNVSVDYTAGYSALGLPIPGDLVLATLWCIEWFYLHNQRGDMGRTQLGKQGEGVSILSDIPPMIRSILNGYKNWDLGLDSSL